MLNLFSTDLQGHIFGQRCRHQRDLDCALPFAQYMDRIYVKHQNKTQVNQLGLDLWRDVVVRNKRIRERLRSTLLGLVHRERAGEVIDRALMRNITTVRAA